MSKWERTDDHQAVKALSADIFLIDNATEYPNGKIEVYRVEININDHVENCKDLLNIYGYNSIEHLQEMYKEHWKQVLAECVAETLYSGSDSDIVFEGDKDSADKYFHNLILKD